MNVCPATPDDAESIATLNAAAWRAAFRGIVSDIYLDTYQGSPETRLHDLISPPEYAMQFVATDSGYVVGWIAGRPCEDADADASSTYEVSACYVLPTHWRRGVGRLLMNHLLIALAGDKWREVVVWTPAKRAQSHAFYESLSFRPDGAQGELDHGGPVAIVRFRMTLANQD